MNRNPIVVVVENGALAERLCHCLEFIGERVEKLLPDDTRLTAKRVLNEPTTIVISDVLKRGDVSAHLPVISFTGQDGENFIPISAPPLEVVSLSDALYAARLFLAQQKYDWPTLEKESLRFPRLSGDSSEMQRVRESMGKAAAKDVTVLITGESGTGKEIVAASLHEGSRRAEKPFVPVNCGAIPADLIESELFGHEKGAFTGAVSTRSGRFELANGGTLFLDEVGDLPHMMQVKLLRVIQERSFERVGGTQTLTTDVRIIAATHCDLEAMIKEGSFREDLYYRLNVYPIRMPALRQHKQDIPELINTLLNRAQVNQQDKVRFTSAAMQALMRYEWPGNVRELANLVERMSVQYPDDIVGVSELPGKFRGEVMDAASPKAASAGAIFGSSTTQLLPINGIDLKEYLTNLEKNLIRQALDDTNSVVARAADRLNIRRTTLVEKMRKYGLNRVEVS